MKRRLLSGILAMVISLAMAIPVVPAFAVTGADPLQDNEKIVDIYINADVDSGIDPAAVKAMLMAKLEGATKNFGGIKEILGAKDIRINTNMISLDVSDLSAWYVYDHYGSDTGAVYENGNQTGKITPPASWTSAFGASSVKRPYFAYYESMMQYASYNHTVYRIQDYLNLPELQQRYVAPLDQHIYALQDGNGDYAMTFVGYGSPAYNDFLFYPATSAGTKEVSFTVDSNYVNTHTMDPTYGGAGFLLNTGIDSSGYIHGFILLYQFNSNSSLSGLNLYKINDNIDVDTFHQGGMFGSYDWETGISYPSCVTKVAGAASLDWSTKMDVQLQITPTKVVVNQKPSSGSSFVKVLDETLTDTAFNGFGPLVQYSSHGCDESTQFRFTKLKMGFATSSSSVMDALAKANFLNDSEKYFVNLLDNDGSASLNDGDWEGVARLRDGEIRYVTNVKNPFLNDGGIVTSGAPNGSNGRTFQSYVDLDDLTDKLVAYILGNNPYLTPSGSVILANPVAIFELVAGDNESVATVVRDFLPAGGLDVFTRDSSIPSTGGSGISTFKYKITSPSGAVQTLPDRATRASASNPLMKVDSSTALGTWTVELVVVDNLGKTSSPAVATFQVKEAEEYDVEIISGAHMSIVDEPPVANPQTVTQYSAMEDIHVKADEGYAVPETYYIGKGIYFIKLTDDTGVVSGIPTGDLTATLKACRMASTITWALGNGEEPTPDTGKYYVTIVPTDPDFEYNIVDEDGNPVPAGQAWVPGTDEPVVFGPYDEPGTYYIAVRPLGSTELPDLIESFTIQGVDGPGEPEATDTGDNSQNGLMALAALMALTGMVATLWRRKQIQ